MTTEYVGCPWQLKNPEQQEWLCYQWITFHLAISRIHGLDKVICMGEHCEHWQVYKRLQALLRQKQEASDGD